MKPTGTMRRKTMKTAVEVPRPNHGPKLSSDALALRSFGTIGYDAYVQWVLKGEDHARNEFEPLPSPQAA